MALSFDAPNKLTCVGDALDGITWSNLPNPTVLYSAQVLPDSPGATGAQLVAGEFTATFNPPGQYVITLAAEGYDTQTWLITATEE